MVNKDEHFVNESKPNPHTAYAGLIQKQEHEFAPLRFGKVIFGRKYAENSVAVCTHSLQHGYAIDKDVVGLQLFVWCSLLSQKQRASWPDKGHVITGHIIYYFSSTRRVLVPTANVAFTDTSPRVGIMKSQSGFQTKLRNQSEPSNLSCPKF